MSEINTIGSSTVFIGNAVFSNATINISPVTTPRRARRSNNVGAGTRAREVSGVASQLRGRRGPAARSWWRRWRTVNPGGAGTTYTAATAGTDVLADAATAGTVVGSVDVYIGTQSFSIATPTAGESFSNLAAQINSALGSAGSAAVTAAGSITITSATAGVTDSVTVGDNDLYDSTGAAAVSSTQTLGTDAVQYPAGSETYVLVADSANDTFTNNGLSFTEGGVTTNVNFTYGGSGTTETQADLITDINNAIGTGTRSRRRTAPIPTRSTSWLRRPR